MDILENVQKIFFYFSNFKRQGERRIIRIGFVTYHRMFLLEKHVKWEEQFYTVLTFDMG